MAEEFEEENAVRIQKKDSCFIGFFYRLALLFIISF